MAYDHHISRIQAPMDDDSPSVEEQILSFEESIGQCVSSTTKANEMMRASMIMRGLDPDAEPEISPELAARLADDAMKSDTDLFFSGALDSGKEFRGKKLKAEDSDIG